MDFVPNMIHSFDSADIGQIAYAIAFAPSVGQAPAPAPPLVLPEPIARFDFNNYTAYSTTLGNSVSGGGDATINESGMNMFNETTPSNKFLSMYVAPFGDQTGGVTLPSLTGITAVEIWVKYQLSVNQGYGQYVYDFREGATSGYWITRSDVDMMGTDFESAKIWFNTTSSIVDTVNGTPNIGNTIAGSGWFQIIVYPSASISDDISFFMRYTGTQGMPIDVADILIYNVPFTDAIVKGLFNDKCSRYGLSPIV